MPEQPRRRNPVMRYLRGDDIGEKWSVSLGGNPSPPDFGTAWISGTQDRVLLLGDQYGGSIDKVPPAGSLMLSSVVMACVQWIMRNFASAPLAVKQKGRDGEIIDDHPLTQLVDFSNDDYGGDLLWSMTVRDYILYGNAYWLPWSNGENTPIQMWHEPAQTIRPVRTRGSGNYIDYYEYYREQRWQRIPSKDDVIHYRFGDGFLGFSPIEAALREVFIDKEASRYMAAMLKNLGVPGAIISAKDKDAPIDPVEVKNLYMEKTQGDKRGEPIVWSLPLNVENPHMSPADMGVAQIRADAIMRIPGLIGLNRMVTGLGEDAKFANMEQAREAAFEENLLPMYLVFARMLGRKLLKRMGNPATEQVIFDTTEVSALQEDMDKMSERVLKQLTEAPTIMVNEARTKLGYDQVPGGDVYLLKKGKEGFVLIPDLEGYGEHQQELLDQELESGQAQLDATHIQNEAASAQLDQNAADQGAEGDVSAQEPGGAGVDNVIAYEEAAA